jgi:iron complex outermembrane receptor protein
VQTLSDYKTFSEELTFSGKSGSLDWVAGAFYWNQKESEPNTQVIYGPPFFPTITPIVVASATVKTDSISGFADVTYEATQGLFLTAGGRYTSEHEDLDYLPGGVGPALTDNHRWNAFTPRAVVRYQFDVDNNVYGSYSKGFKSGAFAGYPPNRVDPEHNDAYEVGFKHSSRVFDLNSAVFYYNFKDPQVTTFDFQTGLSQTINAEGQTNYGAELEMVFRPVQAWQISLAGAYLSATYKNFPQATIFVPVGAGVWSQAPQNADGTTVPRSPKWSGNAATSYDIDTGIGTLQLAANVTWSSYFFHFENEQAREPGYAEYGLNVSLTSRDSHWRGAVFVTNLSDHHSATQLALGPAGTVALWAPPRTFGGSISYRF